MSTQTYIHQHRPRFLRELCDFVRFPSVSGQPRHADDVRRCGEWLAAHLRGIGMEHARVVLTPRHPIVYAEWLHAPNEKFHLPQLWNGIATAIAFLHEIGAQSAIVHSCRSTSAVGAEKY